MTPDDSYSTSMSIAKHKTNRAIEHLMGLITGLVADGQLNDLEIIMLSTWVASHPEVINEYPGSVIAMKVNEILKDGIITEEERFYLLNVLLQLASTDFSSTGSATAEVVKLPIDDNVSPDFTRATVCFTGDFVYGTRAHCFKLAEKVGSKCTDSLTRKDSVLVIGTRVSPDWIHTSHGRKIQQAVEMQNTGHKIQIISERRWLDLLI